MDFINLLIFDKYFLLLLAIVSGLLLGRIKIRFFSLGISGVLFSGLFIGWAATKNALTVLPQSNFFTKAQGLISTSVVPKEFFFFFLLLFITAVGLAAGPDLRSVLKKYGVQFLFISLITTGAGFVSSCIIKLYYPQIDIFQISGIYTGALTSSPGLGVALETAHNVSLQSHNGIFTSFKVIEASIGSGYTIAYPVGILVVLLCLVMIPRVFSINIMEQKTLFDKELKSMSSSLSHEEGPFSPLAFAVVMLSGIMIGMIKIPLGSMGFLRLNSTGGILVSSLILGYQGRLGPLNFSMDRKSLDIITRIGIMVAFATLGLRFGYNMIDNLSGEGFLIAGFSAVVGGVSFVTGFIVGHFVFHINWTILSGALCGAMTSTPGLIASVESIDSDIPATGYGTAYPFGLLFMVIFTTVFFNLFR